MNLEPPSSSRFLLIGWLLFLWIAGLFLYTRNNDAPVFYHRDEPSKAQQLRIGFRNLAHPVLMLEVADGVRSWLGTDRNDIQKTTQIGRNLSAIYCATGVVFLSMLGFLRRGLTGAILLGSLSLIHFRIFDVAHYFKEDAPHFLGITVVLLGATLAGRRKSWGVAVMLGIGVGIAAASKYIGVATLVIALAALLGSKPSWRYSWSLVAICVASALALFSILHANVLLDPIKALQLSRSLDTEIGWMVAGHRGYGHSLPNWLYSKHMLIELAHVGMILVIIAVALRKNWRKEDWIIFSFGLAYFLGLMFMRKFSARYLIPITVVSLIIIVLLLIDWKREGKKALAIGATVLVFGMNLWLLGDLYYGFATDSRRQVVEVMKRADSPKIVQDKIVMLQHAWPENPSLDFTSYEYSPIAGNVSDLKKEGVTHVIVSYDTYYRFLGPTVEPRGDFAEEWKRCRQFYLDLQQKEELLLKTEADHPRILHPGIEVYRLKGVSVREH